MFSINLVTFAICKFLFCHDNLENVTGIDVFQRFSNQLPEKEYIIRVFNFASYSCYPLISEHLDGDPAILLHAVAK